MIALDGAGSLRRMKPRTKLGFDRVAPGSAVRSIGDLGAAPGPRKRRWLTTGVIAFGVIGATVAAVRLTRSPHAPTPGISIRPAQPTRSLSKARLVFGMLPPQVERLTGRPAARRANCWLFHPTTTGMVGSISVQPSFATVPFDPRTTRDLKVCFLGGVYSSSELRQFDERQHRWIWGAWPLSLSPEASR